MRFLCLLIDSFYLFIEDLLKKQGNRKKDLSVIHYLTVYYASLVNNLLTSVYDIMQLKKLKLKKNNWSSESYKFDEVFTESASQKRVYEVVAKPVVEVFAVG